MSSTVAGAARSAVRSGVWREMLGVLTSTDGRGGTTRRPGVLLPDASMRVFGPIVLIGLFFAAGAQMGHGEPVRVPAALGFAAAQVAALTLAWFLPLAGWRVSLLVTVLSGVVLTESSGAPWPLATLVAHLGALFLLALSGSRPVAAAAVLVDAAVFVTWSLLWGARIDVVLAGPVVALLVGGFGAALGAQRRTARALDESQRDTVVSQTRRAALEERVRIARDLHDVVAHHLSRIAVRAESAPVRVAGAGPEVTVELHEIAADARARSRTCGGCWGCCAPTTGLRSRPPPVWTTWLAWSTRPAAPAPGCGSSEPGLRDRSHRTSGSRATGWCRRR